MEEQKRPRVRMGFEQQSAEQQSRIGECLWDAHAAGAKILELTAGGNFDEFAQHLPLQEFAATMVRIMAGALRELERNYATEAAGISELRPTIDFAEREGEGLADPAALWRFVQGPLAALVGELAERLEQWHTA